MYIMPIWIQHSNYVISIISVFVSPSQRNDEEAVVDRGGYRSMVKTNFEKEEHEGTLCSTIP